MTLLVKKKNYCECTKCLGNQIPSANCPCKICRNCAVHMGLEHTEQESTVVGICEGCYNLRTLGLICDGKGLDLLVAAVYDRAFQDALSEDGGERVNSVRWINSESFYYYPKLLGLKLEGLRKGILERIEHKLKSEHREYQSI